LCSDGNLSLASSSSSSTMSGSSMKMTMLEDRNPAVTSRDTKAAQPMRAVRKSAPSCGSGGCK
jgi:hypothetical protein